MSHFQQYHDRNTYITSRSNGSLKHILNSREAVDTFDYAAEMPLCLSHATREAYSDLIHDEVQSFYRGDKMPDNGTGEVYNANPDDVETVNVSFTGSHNDKQGDLLDRLLTDCTLTSFENAHRNSIYFIKHTARWQGNTFHPDKRTLSTTPVNKVRLMQEMRKCKKSRSYKQNMFKRLVSSRIHSIPVYSPFPRIAKSFYTHEHGKPCTLFDVNNDSTREYETTIYKGIYPFKADDTADVHIKPVAICGENTTHYPPAPDNYPRAHVGVAIFTPKH